MSTHYLNDYGLLSKVISLIQLNNQDTALMAAKMDAEKAWKDNLNMMAKLRTELGAHTAYSGKPEIVILKNGTAVYIPAPHEGATSTEVYPQLMTPRGLQFYEKGDSSK